MSGGSLWLDRRASLAREVAVFGVLLGVVPVGLVIVFGPSGGLGPALRLYAQVVIVTASVALAMRSSYAAAGVLFPGPMGAVGRVGVHGATVLVGSVLGAEVASAVLALGWGGDAASYRWALIRISLVVSAGVAIGLAAWDRWRARIHQARIRELEAISARTEAELKLLRARTRPHFLFNSLNTVAGLIHEEPDRAEEVLERMSSLFRYALAGSERSRVSLQDELEAATDYLRVQQIRFGDRLRFEVHPDPALDAVQVLPLLLQPLVENAVLHGVGGREEGGTVQVRATCSDGVVELVVEDDGVGPGGSTHREGAGSALVDLRASLDLTYRGRASLVEDHPPTGGFRVVVRIPEERP